MRLRSASPRLAPVSINGVRRGFFRCCGTIAQHSLLLVNQQLASYLIGGQRSNAGDINVPAEAARPIAR